MGMTGNTRMILNQYQHTIDIRIDPPTSPDCAVLKLHFKVINQV